MFWLIVITLWLVWSFMNWLGFEGIFKLSLGLTAAWLLMRYGRVYFK